MFLNYEAMHALALAPFYSRACSGLRRARMIALAAYSRRLLSRSLLRLPCHDERRGGGPAASASVNVAGSSCLSVSTGSKRSPTRPIRFTAAAGVKNLLPRFTALANSLPSNIRVHPIESMFRVSDPRLDAGIRSASTRRYRVTSISMAGGIWTSCNSKRCWSPSC